MPLGWALYLPEDWCEDDDRRRKAKIPDEVTFKTKPELGVELVERAAQWDIPAAPVLGDHAYGENSWLRDRLDDAGCEYVLSVGPKAKVFEQGTTFAVPAKKPGASRAPVHPRPDRQPRPIGELIADLESDAQMVTFRDGPAGEPVTSRFIFARVHAGHGWLRRPGSAAVLNRPWPNGRDCFHTRLLGTNRPTARIRISSRVMSRRDWTLEAAAVPVIRAECGVCRQPPPAGDWLPSYLSGLRPQTENNRRNASPRPGGF